jgi:hypothetical protein
MIPSITFTRQALCSLELVLRGPTDDFLTVIQLYHNKVRMTVRRTGSSGRRTVGISLSYCFCVLDYYGSDRNEEGVLI